VPDFDLTFKMLLFGDGGVGKTSLTQRFLTGLFMDNTRITIGVEFHIKDIEIDGKRIKLQIWDFGGEDRFRFLLPSYCRGAMGGIFLYSTTAYSSFTHFDEWMKVVNENAQGIPVIIAGTKIDLPDRQVPTEEAVALAQSRGAAGFAEVSAKTGDNVESVFATITRLMMAAASGNDP